MANVTKELLRQRFAELQAAKADAEARLAPIRAQIDALRAQEQAITDQIKPLVAAKRAIEVPELVEIDNELGLIAKALGGKTIGDAADTE